MKVLSCAALRIAPPRMTPFRADLIGAALARSMAEIAAVKLVIGTGGLEMIRPIR